MDVQIFRQTFDTIDVEMSRLFAERMALSAQIAAYKKEHGLPVLDAAREREKLSEVEAKLPDELREYGASFYRHVFELSRERQERVFLEADGKGD